MEIPEAIKLIQEMKSWMPSDNKNFDKEREAIDTMVAYCKKPLPTDDEIREMSNEYARKHTEPEAGYVLNRRFGFQNGATWMRDLIQERIKK